MKMYLVFLVVFSLNLFSSDEAFDNCGGCYKQNKNHVFNLEKSFSVIPLGCDCRIIVALNELGLRNVSYPYDWCVAPFDGILRSIENDFEEFVEPSQLKLVHERAPGNKYGVELRHDFPRRFLKMPGGKRKALIVKNWENYISEVQKKYERRISRFRQSCDSQRKIYFIRHGHITPEQAEKFRDLLSYKYPQLNFLLVCVVVDFDETKIEKLDNIHILVVKENALLQSLIDFFSIEKILGEKV